MKLPSLNLKQWLGISALVLITGATSYLSGKHLNPKIERVQVGQEKIDEDIWVKRTEYESQRTLNQQLKDRNERLSQNIDSLESEVDQLVSVNYKLDTTIDSLSQKPDTVKLKGNVEDTSATFTKTFGSGLFLVTSKVNIIDNNLSNDLFLDQQRDIQMDVALQGPPDPKVFLHSPDIKDIKIQSITTNEPPRFSRAELAIGGIVLGSTLTTTLILIL